MDASEQPGHPTPDWTLLRSEAVCARDRDDHSGALALFRQAAAAAPERPWILLDVADQLRRLDRLDEAEAVYLEAVSKDPVLAQGFRGLGLIARQRGDRAAAVERFREAAARAPENIWLWFDLASDLRELGRLDEAADAYKKMLGRDPKAFHAWRGLAQIARLRGDRAEALDCFRVAAIFNPSDIWTAQDAATEFRELGRFDEAAAAFRQVLALDAGFAPAWRGLALVARARGDRETALDSFRRAAECDAKDLWSAYDAAVLLNDLGLLDEASAACRALVARAPDFAPGWRARIPVARAQGDREALRESLAAVARLEPQNPWSHFHLAAELREQGRVDDAEAAYRAAAALDPELAHVNRALGLIARERGDHEAALPLFRAAARNEPANVWMRNDVAVTLAALGRHDEAEALMAALAAERPESADALLAYAPFLRRRGFCGAELVALLEKAAGLAPDNPGAQLGLAEEFLRVQRLDEAEAIFDARLALAPDDVRALMGRAQAARRRGDRARALQDFEAAARAPGGHVWAVVEYADELKEAGRVEEARGVLDAEIARRDRPELHMRLGFLAREASDGPGARAAFAGALAVAPGFDEARIELAVEDFRQGDAEAAIGALKDLLSTRPDHARGLAALGDFADQIDDMDSAVELRRKAVAADPANLWIRAQLAESLAKLGRGAEAEAELAACQARFGDAPEICLARAKNLTMLGEAEAAFALLSDGVAAFPHHFDLWARWVAASIARGDFDAAGAALEAAGPAGARERAQVLQLRGALAASAFDLAGAYRAFADALALRPADGWLHECAGRTALLRCDFEPARRHLAAATNANAAHRVSHRGGAKPSQSLLGQLLDEFRIDAEIGAMLRDALAAQDIAGLAGAVAEALESTAAAMALMIAFRRGGRLEPAGSGLAKSSIPRAIMQFWDENIPAEVDKLCEGWRAAHPDFVYRRFSSLDAARFLAGQGAGAAAAFKRAREPAMKADLFRLAWLARHGGWYVDADDRCLAPLSGLEADGRDLILYQEENLGSTGNNLIGVAPGHPVILAALDQAILAVNRGDSDILWLSTGPGLLTRCVAAWLVGDLDARLGRTRILTHSEASRCVAIWTAAAYKHTSRHWSRTVFGRARAVLRGKAGAASVSAA